MPIHPTAFWRITQMAWNALFGPPCAGSMSGPDCCDGLESGSTTRRPSVKIGEPRRKNSKGRRSWFASCLEATNEIKGRQGKHFWPPWGVYPYAFYRGIFSLIRDANMISCTSGKKLGHFKQKRAYALFCPLGQVSFDEMAELMSRAVLRCRRGKIKNC